ncbi:MAG: Flp family type IVb pilin [Limnobacter sp.]|nr:Flp family type IVb pilin [Limnobacter sp.]
MKVSKFAITSQKKNQQGATMLEYGIIVALIVVGAVALLPGLGDQLTAAFQSIVNALPAAA